MPRLLHAYTLVSIDMRVACLDTSEKDANGNATVACVRCGKQVELFPDSAWEPDPSACPDTNATGGHFTWNGPIRRV